MKNLFNRLALGVAMLLLGSAAPVVAQIPTTIASNTNDNPPDGSTAADASYVHTGTDAIDLGGKQLQVMTWDNGAGIVTLSWDIDNRTQGIDGSFPLPGNLSDPDVVVSFRNGRLYANVVCIDRARGAGGQTRLFGFEWVNNSFSLLNQPFTSFWLGSIYNKHSHPNIDVNALGMTAIVWQQSKESKVLVTVTSPDFPTYPFTKTITFGRSFLACSYIDNGVIGPCYRYYNPNNGYTQTGIPVLDPPTGLFEQTLRPDVAISETVDEQSDPPVVSTTFIRHFVDGFGEFTIVDSLDVKQTLYNQCKEKGEGGGFVLVEVDSKEWGINSLLSSRGTPRIAATPNASDVNRADVEVVLDAHSGGCYENIYEIHNYGKTNNAFRPGSTLVSLPNLTFPLPNSCQGTTNLRKRTAKEPVVSYYPGDRGLKGYYIVTWTGRDYTDIDPASDPTGGKGEDDVWASTLIDGVPEQVISGTIAQRYSAVNSQTYGDQHTPSVAGRHMMGNDFTAHLFVDDAKQRLAFKQTTGIAGSTTPLRPAPATKLLQAYPNPSDGAMTVQLQLNKGETARQLTVVDQLGRTVDQVALTNATPEQPLTWKPSPQLPSGTYVLKLVTSERTANLTVSHK